MAMPEPDPTVPKTFISYSWDDVAHKEWVKQLATRLRADGVDVTLDRWHSAPGDQIPAFMERAVRENDFVIAVCTPRFKERSEERGGGVGYEGDIMTAYAFTGGDKRKFIPVLRRGSWREAAPTWLLGRAMIDLSRDPYSESEYEELLRTLHGAREEAPPIGHRPNFGDKKGSQASPAPAPVTPLVGSSTPQRQSSVTPALSKMADPIIKGAYEALKTLLIHKFGRSSEAVASVEKLEQNPDSTGRKETLREVLAAAKAAEDAEILQAAQTLLEKIRSQPGGPELVQQTVTGNQNIFSGSGDVTVQFGHPRDSRKA